MCKIMVKWLNSKKVYLQNSELNNFSLDYFKAKEIDFSDVWKVFYNLKNILSKEGLTGIIYVLSNDGDKLDYEYFGKQH